MWHWLLQSVERLSVQRSTWAPSGLVKCSLTWLVEDSRTSQVLFSNSGLKPPCRVLPLHPQHNAFH